MIDEITRLMRLLEFSDSAFPVGTFSFSNGLETAAFEGIVYDAQTLEQYTRTALRQTIYSDAIAALIAFRAAAGGNYKTILEADRQIILCKMNAEARLMLIRMGKKMAEICTQITVVPDEPLVGRYSGRTNTGNLSCSTSDLFSAKWFYRERSVRGYRVWSDQYDSQCGFTVCQSFPL